MNIVMAVVFPNRIVLDAGYFLDNRSFFENFFSISVYAVIVSTLLLSLLLLSVHFATGNCVECFCHRLVWYSSCYIKPLNQDMLCS